MPLYTLISNSHFNQTCSFLFAISDLYFKAERRQSCSHDKKKLTELKINLSESQQCFLNLTEN